MLQVNAGSTMCPVFHISLIRLVADRFILGVTLGLVLMSPYVWCPRSFRIWSTAKLHGSNHVTPLWLLHLLQQGVRFPIGGMLGGGRVISCYENFCYKMLPISIKNITNLQGAILFQTTNPALLLRNTSMYLPYFKVRNNTFHISPSYLKGCWDWDETLVKASQ